MNAEQYVEEIKKIKLFLKQFDLENYNNNAFTTTSTSSFDNKNVKIYDFILNLKNSNSNFTNKNEFSKIRNFAISQGGFICNNNRKEIYQKLFGVNNSLNFNLKSNFHPPKNKVFNAPNSSVKNKSENFIKNIPAITLNFKDEFFIEERNIIIENEFEHHYKDIIEKDINRSVITQITNNYFNIEKDEEIYFNNLAINLIKKQLHSMLKNLFNFSNLKYDYYQGFHDFSLYIFILYFDNPKLGIIMLQRIVEIYLKDYLDYSNRNNQSVFETVISIIRETIRQIDQKVYDELEEDNGGVYANLLTSWVICLFTRDSENFNLGFRILDYLFCSHPLAVYVMTANLVIDEWNNYKNKNSKGEGDKNSNIDDKSFLEHIKEIKFNKIDFDLLIMKSENNLQKFIKGEIKFIETEFKDKLIINSPLKSTGHGGITILHDFYEKKNFKNKKLNENYLVNNNNLITICILIISIVFVVFVYNKL